RALGALTALWPLAVRAQQTEPVRRIGVLAPFNSDDPESLPNLDAFKQRLAELGWSGDRNIAVDYRFTSGSPEEIRSAAARLVATAPEVIFAASNVSVMILQRATTTIPIVFTQVSDAIGNGIVTSLAHPGGNISGFQGYDAAIGGKWIEVLKELAPSVSR